MIPFGRDHCYPRTKRVWGGLPQFFFVFSERSSFRARVGGAFRLCASKGVPQGNVLAVTFRGGHQ